MHPIVYGIPNCDTVKKARTWLTDQGIQATFHDFKKQGVPDTALDTWMNHLGWETLLNRQGTTWRKLDTSVQAGVTDSDSAKALMLAHASCIKRPVIVWPSGQITVGFKPEQWPA
ncbi:ArsC family reductase [Limnohabitans sp. Rim28]|uniref:ArsC family reductase n=1 Tax=Limnohabitans sp. Rim28 TaxID=1100720 RepID=UPI0002FA6F1D|nr:ArsC family reductase [Limnohabitans sp. Rim28]PVE05438.1 arsenate reductase [Limnohabitans sp. Rim28]